MNERAHTIHHVTAVTADLEQNLSFYTRTLGLRLVKRTVNQDDVSAYHLFYADRDGNPGTDLTFFDWPLAGASRPGPGTVATILLRVPGSSLDWWEDRLLESGAQPQRGIAAEERPGIAFSDPEGQRLMLVDDSGLAGETAIWDREIDPEHAVRGILGVDLESLDAVETGRVLRDLLGYEQQHRQHASFDTGDEHSHGLVRIVQSSSSMRGRVGAGGVHHVAFRVRDDEELLAMQTKIESAGLRTSGLIDRFYFHSLYFREPGGVLFELATDGPGFATDEAADALGDSLSLPPFLEPRREEIEAGLVSRPIPAIR